MRLASPWKKASMEVTEANRKRRNIAEDIRMSLDRNTCGWFRKFGYLTLTFLFL